MMLFYLLLTLILLIQRMGDENHEIGLYSLEHQNAWLYSYFYTKKTLNQV